MNYNQLEKAYAALLLDPEYARLELLKQRPNIFSALRIVHYENRHSNFLGWLMDPNQTHALGAKFLKWVLSDIFQDERVKSVSVADIAKLRFENTVVFREWNNIDLLIVIEDVVVVFENKVHSGEHSDQLNRYKKIIDDNFKNNRKVFVFLSPSGGASSMGDIYVNYSFGRVLILLERLLDVYNTAILPSVLLYIQDYIETIKTHFMSNSETNILARKIYGNHKELFDFVFSQSPNPLKEISGYIYKKLNEKGWVKCFSERNFIRFLTPELRPMMPTNGTSWKGESFVFEFHFSEDHFEFYYTIGPGNETTRQILKDKLNNVDGNYSQEEDGGYYVYSKKEVDIEPIRLQLNDAAYLDQNLVAFWNHVYRAVSAAETAILQVAVELQKSV